MVLIKCPECLHQVSSHAAACPHCGFPMQAVAGVPPVAAATAVSSPVTLPLREIAYRQKLLLYALLVLLLSQVPIFVLLVSGSLAVLGWIGVLANLALEVWCLYKLGQAMGMSLPAIWICSFGLLIPVVSLFVLMVVNSRATRILKNAGVRVRLMGAALEEVP